MPIKVIIADDHQAIYETLHLGVRAYLLKDTNPEELVTAVRTISRGGTYHSAYISEKMANPVLKTGERHLRAPLFSPKETTIAEMLCSGASAKEIGAAIYQSGRTVEHYIERMREKTGTRNTTELVVHALLHGLVPKQNLCSVSYERP